MAAVRNKLSPEYFLKYFFFKEITVSNTLIINVVLNQLDIEAFVKDLSESDKNAFIFTIKKQLYSFIKEILEKENILETEDISPLLLLYLKEYGFLPIYKKEILPIEKWSLIADVKGMALYDYIKSLNINDAVIDNNTELIFLFKFIVQLSNTKHIISFYRLLYVLDKLYKNNPIKNTRDFDTLIKKVLWT